MTRNDIIRLAKEVGFSDRSNPMWGSMVASHEEIERFAKLVAKAEREKEREACARVCEEVAQTVARAKRPPALNCAAAIRARG
jgi:hypothetical protein